MRVRCARIRQSSANAREWHWTSSHHCLRSTRTGSRQSAIAWAALSPWNSPGTARPATAGQVKAKILVCTGADDPFVPAAQVNALADEMTKAGADWQIISYGGTVHSFTNPDAGKVGNPGLKYNKASDERSWKAMASFFEEIFAA